jgi:hypothetical protein
MQRCFFSGRDNLNVAQLEPHKSFSIEIHESEFEAWSHIAGVGSSEAVKLYVDGILVGDEAIPVDWDFSSTQLFTSGASQESAHGTSAANFDGSRLMKSLWPSAKRRHP